MQCYLPLTKKFKQWMDKVCHHTMLEQKYLIIVMPIFLFFQPDAYIVAGVSMQLITKAFK